MINTHHHGIIFDIKNSKKLTLSPKTLSITHNIQRQCCGYITQAWAARNLVFAYPQAYLEGENQAEQIEKWLNFLSATPFTGINYHGLHRVEDLVSESYVLTYKQQMDVMYGVNKEYKEQKPRFSNLHIFTIDRGITPQYALAKFSMIRTLFLTQYNGIVSRCYELKELHPKVDHFHLLQMAILSYKGSTNYCGGGYNIMRVWPIALDSTWEWLLCDTKTYIKNISNIEGNVGINRSFLPNCVVKKLVEYLAKDYDFRSKTSYSEYVYGVKKEEDMWKNQRDIINAAKKGNYEKFVELSTYKK